MFYSCFIGYHVYALFGYTTVFPNLPIKFEFLQLVNLLPVFMKVLAVVNISYLKPTAVVFWDQVN